MLFRSGKFPGESVPKLLKSGDPALIRFVLEQLDEIPMSEGVRNEVWGNIPEEWIDKSASIAMAMAYQASRDPAASRSLIARALVTHANDPWVLESTNFLKAESVDGILKAALASDADIKKVQRLAERLVPKATAGLRKDLLKTVASDQGTRPAWHFLLARQFSSADSNGLDEQALEKLLDSAQIGRAHV